MLSQQIRQGAEYDVFLSANERFVDQLVVARSVEPGSKVVYAQGQLGLWSKQKLAFEDIARVRNLAIANPEHAPYGLAAKEALIHRGLWEQVRSRTVYGENVRQALQYAQTGNADAALIAWSLVKDKGGRLVPSGWHRPIIQTAAIPKRSRNKEAARKLLSFLLSAEGRNVLALAGFLAPPLTPQSRPASPGR